MRLITQKESCTSFKRWSEINFVDQLMPPEALHVVSISYLCRKFVPFEKAAADNPLTWAANHIKQVKNIIKDAGRRPHN